MRDGESLWAVMNSWLTPSFLFLFLNLTIGTIAFISSLASQKKQQNHPQELAAGGDASPPGQNRAPSLIDRVRSFEFSLYASPVDANPQDPPEAEPFQPEHPVDDSNGPTRLARAPSLLERVKSFKFSFDKNQHYSQPDPVPQEPVAVPSDNPKPNVRNAGPGFEAMPAPRLRTPMKLRKSLSARWSFWSRNLEEEEEIDRRRPATVRERGSKAAAGETESPSTHGGGDDEGVDAKADDFINRFKQQLKLQRLDSLLRGSAGK